MTEERRIDRLDKFAKYKTLNDNNITKECGLSIGILGKSRKPGKDITLKTCATILEHYPDLSREWLLNGEGEMLYKNIEPGRGYPFIDTAYAECGRAFGYLESFSREQLPMVSMPGIPSSTEFFIKSSGYSMVNKSNPELSIPPGSYVGLSKITGSVIRWGEVYAIATIDGIMLKKIQPDPEDESSIICSSYNSEEYPAFSLLKEEIVDMAKITCVIPIIIR